VSPAARALSAPGSTAPANRCQTVADDDDSINELASTGQLVSRSLSGRSTRTFLTSILDEAGGTALDV